ICRAKLRVSSRGLTSKRVTRSIRRRHQFSIRSVSQCLQNLQTNRIGNKSHAPVAEDKDDPARMPAIESADIQSWIHGRHVVLASRLLVGFPLTWIRGASCCGDRLLCWLRRFGLTGMCCIARISRGVLVGSCALIFRVCRLWMVVLGNVLIG